MIKAHTRTSQRSHLRLLPPMAGDSPYDDILKESTGSWYNRYRSELSSTRMLAAVAIAAAGLSYAYIKLHQPEKVQPGEPQSYIVRAGDTEWSLARMIAPNVDPRKKIDEIDNMLPDDFAHANHTLQTGDVITYSGGKILSYTESGVRG